MIEDVAKPNRIDPVLNTVLSMKHRIANSRCRRCRESVRRIASGDPGGVNQQLTRLAMDLAGGCHCGRSGRFEGSAKAFPTHGKGSARNSTLDRTRRDCRPQRLLCRGTVWKQAAASRQTRNTQTEHQQEGEGGVDEAMQTQIDQLDSCHPPGRLWRLTTTTNAGV